MSQYSCKPVVGKVSSDSPKSPVLSSGAPWDHFSDKDAGVFSNVRVVCATCDAEAQPRICLDTKMENVLLKQQITRFY